MEDDISWGDESSIKNKQDFRITTVNINGLPQQRNHPKYGTIRQQVSTHHIDILGLSEINLRWNRFSCYDRLPQRTSKWWENSHCSYAYNAHDLSTSKFQPGGTAILSIDHLSHKVTPSTRYDPTGLGRWTSTLYLGKKNTLLRVIQVYRPCKPNPLSANGVYQQHSRYLLSKGIITCPRDHLLTDLHTFISQCLTSQEQIIVMGDFNDNVTQPPITSFFDSLHMHNLTSSLFGHSYRHSPNTYIRGHSTIDAIFGTQGVQATRGGYLPTHIFDSDHKPIWVDIQFRSIFGSTLIHQIPYQRRRLKNEDPRTVAKFNTRYNSLLLHHKLPQALANLQSSATIPLQPEHQQEYERIDRLRVRSLLLAEKNCRKLRTGNIEFSPTIQHQRNLIRFWKLLSKRKRGHKIDTKYLTRWEKKLDIHNSFTIPLPEINQHLKTAYDKYKCLKKEHTALRDEWLDQLAAARAEAGNKDSTIELANLRQREKIRIAFRQIRWCLHQDEQTAPITTVTEVAHNSIIHHSDKTSVEQAILTANNKKYRQTNDTPPMTTLFPILGRFGTTSEALHVLNGTYEPPPHLDEYSKKLVKEFAKPPHIRHSPNINISYTTKRSR